MAEEALGFDRPGLRIDIDEIRLVTGVECRGGGRDKGVRRYQAIGAVRPGATRCPDQSSGEGGGAIARRDALGAFQPEMSGQASRQSESQFAEIRVPPPPVDFLDVWRDPPCSGKQWAADHARVQ